MYILKNNNELVYGAKSFYFNSDLLIASGTNAKNYTLQDGVDSITININNYDDKLRISEVNINYEVTLTDSAGAEVSKKTGTLTKNVKTDKAITFDNLDAGSYTVTAVATKPYHKILTANFHLQATNDNIEYSVTDIKNSQIVQLTVTTKDYSGNATITFPENIIPDNTDPYFKNYDKQTNANAYTVNLQNNSEYTFKFFKSVPSTVYTKSNFTITK
ncbi:MAG: hypothetical protein IJ093_03315 [Bacilli bacterium]|nr:hypothetical protein [Bacilli bacterium]